MNGLALCSGVGGLELGLRLALGTTYQTVCYVEREAFAASIIVARMEDKALDQAPVWDDIKTFDGKPWRGIVDIVTAGYPCQPFSIAGQRRGTGDARHLWPDILRIIGEAEPAFVFLENVPGHLSIGFREVGEDLRRLGYTVAAGLFTAEEVGAPHRRERLFILAQHQGRCSRGTWKRKAASHDSGPVAVASKQQVGASRQPWKNKDEELAHPHSQKRWKCNGEAGDQPSKGSKELDNAAGPRRNETRFRQSTESKGGECMPSQRRTDVGNTESPSSEGIIWTDILQGRTWPPGPADDWSGIHPSLEPAVCRMADGISYRVDRLRALGNAVVPIVAAKAFTVLSRSLQE